MRLPFSSDRTARQAPGEEPSFRSGRALFLAGLLLLSCTAVLTAALHDTLKPSSSTDRPRQAAARRPQPALPAVPDPWTAEQVRRPISPRQVPSSPPPPSKAARRPTEPPDPTPAPAGMPLRDAMPPKAASKPDALRIEAVRVARSPDGKETLTIRASGPFTPQVFTLEGENPFGSSSRLVVDVHRVGSVAAPVTGRVLNGRVLKRVRIAYVSGQGTFRAVLDLEPGAPFRSTREVSPDGRFVLSLKPSGEVRPDPEIRIRAIALQPGEDPRSERLLVQADRFFEPVVFGLDHANPYGEDTRIVLDIPGASLLAPDRPPAVETGRLVRKVRTHHHEQENKLRVVLDLTPAAGYEASQSFFKKQNIYCLSLRQRVGTPEPVQSPAPAETVEAPVPGRSAASETTRAGAGGRLRSEAGDLDEERVRAMFREHGFYSTCGIYNAQYCNQDGDFANRFRRCGDRALCDGATGLMWERDGSKAAMSWDDAAAYIRGMNRRKAGGHSDWRLPTLEELLSLMERSWGDAGLYIDDRFDAGPRSCWSGDLRGTDRAWKANFHLGYAVDASMEEKNWVRAVRTLGPQSRWTGPRSPLEADDPPRMARQE